LAMRTLLLAPGWILMNRQQHLPWMLVGASPHSSRTDVDDVGAAIHAVEHDAFAINCIAIAMCPGLLSPMICVAVALCLVARFAIHAILNCDHASSHRPPLPIACVGYLLVVQTLYSVPFLYINGVQIIGILVAVMNWILFTAVLLRASPGPIGSGSGDEMELKGLETLSEPLICETSSSDPLT
jgi:hypothetical protein